MRALPAPARAAAAVSAAALVLGLLSGCTGTPFDGLFSQGVEDAVNGTTGGEVDLSGELPADFPASVPLIDGEIELTGGVGSAGGWVVVLTSAAADPLADAAAALKEAGFSEQTGVSGQVAAGALYSDGSHLVVLAGDGSTVTYTVTVAP
ncbi:hypothetical protein [Agromyces arachidis]|uniref:hypothetical protein n=1 Tax=Agromyces arachidis TaxID=766966 RepID=UPI0040568F41